MDTRVQSIIELIGQQPNRHFKLKELAQHVELSACRLDHLFSQSVGISCKQYVILSHMTLAAELLRNTFLTVKEISDRCGFEDQNYFNRRFKQCFGVTPLEYRRLHQQKNVTGKGK